MAVITVASIAVNEGSSVVVFSISGPEGTALSLAVGGTADPSDNEATLSNPLIEYSTDDGASWTTYSWDGSNGDRPTIPASGNLLVRVGISSEQDGHFEGDEVFALTATPDGGEAAVGIATLKDDGSGNYWIDNSASPATTQQLSDAEITLDDDRTIALQANAPIVNERSPFALFTLHRAYLLPLCHL